MKPIFLLLFSLMVAKIHSQNVTQVALRKAGVALGSSTPKTYPIHLWNDFILIDAEVNGITGTFIWDNGLSFCALDSVFAERAGIRFNKHKTDSVVDGNDKVLTLKAQYARKIQVGDFAVESSSVFDLNIDHGFLKNKEHVISGLIGGGFSNHFNWYFDFDKKTVTISPKVIEQEGIRVKYVIDSFNNLHYMPLTLNGSELFAQVDFGMVGEVLSGSSQLAPLFVGHPVVTTFGYNSISAGGLSRMDTIFTIRGDYSYLLSGQHLNELPDIELSGSQVGFTIGSRFFQHYNVTINNSDSVYILSPRAAALPARTKKSYGIFVLKKAENLYIGRLTNNPNLDGKTLQLLERVKSINGKIAQDFYGMLDLRDYQERLVNEGKVLVLKMENGKEYTFTPQNDIAN